jgi:hypothetical protein
MKGASCARVFVSASPSHLALQQTPLSNAWSSNRLCYKFSPTRYSVPTGGSERGWQAVEGRGKDERFLLKVVFHQPELIIGLAKRPIYVVMRRRRSYNRA